MRTVGHRLHSWRTRRGLSLRALATLSRVSYISIFKIEHGRMSPTVDALERLARVLRVTVHDLIPRTPTTRRGKR